MSRKKNKGNTSQMTFNFPVEMADLIGLEGGSQEALSDFEFRFRQLLKTVLEDAAARASDPLDRIEVAARMSRRLGREITKTHIDQWTAMSTVQRRMHVDALKAFCEVVADNRPIISFVESCGLKALTPDEAICAEYGAMMIFKRKVDSDLKDALSGVDEDALHRRLLQRLQEGKK